MTFERAEAGVKTQETEERTVEVRRQESPRVSRLAVISEVCCSWAARYDLLPDVVHTLRLSAEEQMYDPEALSDCCATEIPVTEERSRMVGRFGERNTARSGGRAVHARCSASIASLTTHRPTSECGRTLLHYGMSAIPPPFLLSLDARFD
jgi:hypothetical protein